MIITEEGKDLIDKVSEYALPFKKALDSSNQNDLEKLFYSIAGIIERLNKQGVIQVQRICFGCRFYIRQNNDHYSGLLNKQLVKKTLG